MTCVSGELNQPVTVTRRATATESLHRTPPLANTSPALAPARRTEQVRKFTRDPQALPDFILDGC
jgi:hypothetical protein